MRAGGQAVSGVTAFSVFNSGYFQRSCQILWALGVILLPFTSLPVLVRISGASTVAPPSNLVFIILALVWLLPYVLLNNRIPVEVKPLMVFAAVVIITWLSAFFLPIPPFKGQHMLTEGADAFITLFMALTIYLLSASWLSANRNNLKVTLTLINIGGLLVVGWSLFQAYYVFFNNNIYPNFLYELQSLFSSRVDGLFSDRVTGMAYEPSWLAHQLNLVYLPIWLSATLSGYSSARFRLWRISLENILLVVGVFTLFISFSRVGWLSFFLVLAFLAVKVNLRLAQIILIWISARVHVRRSLHNLIRNLLSISLIILFLTAYTASLIGLLKFGARFEPRLERFFNDPFSAGGVYEITNQLAFAERVIFWSTGWEIVNDHPFLGVGLGNAGFYFPEKMPAFGWALWEVSQVFYYQGHLPNIKSLWVRILAETGILGFTIFLVWNYLLWFSGRLARLVKDPLLRVTGTAGQLVLIAFIVEGFSIDSFALPYYWFSVGLLSATAFLARKQIGLTVDSGSDKYG
jgi:O-antigen ligase